MKRNCWKCNKNNESLVSEGYKTSIHGITDFIYDEYYPLCGTLVYGVSKTVETILNH